MIISIYSMFIFFIFFGLIYTFNLHRPNKCQLFSLSLSIFITTYRTNITCHAHLTLFPYVNLYLYIFCSFNHLYKTQNIQRKLSKIITHTKKVKEKQESHIHIMKLVWSPETALKSYIDTVKMKSVSNFQPQQQCEKCKESGVAELLSSMAAGWNAKFIVECYSQGGPIAASIGLAVAARNTGARHVCIVPDEGTRQHYTKALAEMGVSPPPEIVHGEAETVIKSLDGLDFLVVDCRLRDFARVLKVAKVSARGAVLTCKNAWQRSNFSWFKWNMVLERGTRVVRSVFLPVGMGLDIAYIGSRNGGGGVASSSGGSSKGTPSRWIKHIDQQSGEEHLYRETSF